MILGTFFIICGLALIGFTACVCYCCKVLPIQREMTHPIIKQLYLAEQLVETHNHNYMQYTISFPINADKQ